MKINPKKILWADATQRVDGSAFSASEFQAYELGVSPDGTIVTALLALPVAYGVGESPIPSAVQDNTGVVQFIHLRTMDTTGLVSDWSPGIDVRFNARPLAPSGLAAG